MNNNGPFTTEELLNLVEGLAKRYRGYSHKDDLKQEALLAYYEALEKGNTEVNNLVTIIRKAMDRFANYKSSPVKIPNSGENYKLARKLSQDDFDKLSQRDKALYQAIHPEVKTIDSYENILEVDSIPTLERVELKIAFEELLTDKERTVVAGRIFNGESNVELADKLDCTQQWVSQMYVGAMKKLKERL